MDTTIAALQRRVYETARDRGHHDDLTIDRYGTLVRLCLVHTEVSEAAQVVKRHGLADTWLPVLGEELADAMIRLLEMAEGLGLDLGTLIVAKDMDNRSRPYRYGHPEERDI